MTRNEKGQFVKGVSGNPKGRAKREREREYMDALICAVSPQDWADIIKRAVSDAKRGDTAARKWLADYLIGPPVQKQETTGADGGPLEIRFVDADAEPRD